MTAVCLIEKSHGKPPHSGLPSDYPCISKQLCFTHTKLTEEGAEVLATFDCWYEVSTGQGSTLILIAVWLLELPSCVWGVCHHEDSWQMSDLRHTVAERRLVHNHHWSHRWHSKEETSVNLSHTNRRKERCSSTDRHMWSKTVKGNYFCGITETVHQVLPHPPRELPGGKKKKSLIKLVAHPMLTVWRQVQGSAS